MPRPPELCWYMARERRTWKMHHTVEIYVPGRVHEAIDCGPGQEGQERAFQLFWRLAKVIEQYAMEHLHG